MTNYEYGACRNLIAAVLYQGLVDSAFPTYTASRHPLTQRKKWLGYKREAREWVEGPEAEHLANQLGIDTWPPKEKVYSKLREEIRQRRMYHVGKRGMQVGST